MCLPARSRARLPYLFIGSRATVAAATARRARHRDLIVFRIRLLHIRARTLFGHPVYIAVARCPRYIDLFARVPSAYARLASGHVFFFRALYVTTLPIGALYTKQKATHTHTRTQ